MQRPIRPEWLLRQAAELGGRGSGAGQPRNADLRRAVSAAYYALFHDVALRTARQLLPSLAEADRWDFARLIPHSGIRQVCDWVIGAPAAPARVAKSVLVVRNNSDLLDVALIYQALYHARHAADYDHAAEFSRPATLALVDQAEDAVKKLARQQATAAYERFLAHIATSAKMK